MNLYSEKDMREIEILQFLKEVIDPELEINIIDMGLVYKVNYDAAGEITINLTLSSKNCPMGDVIINGVENCLQAHFPGFKITINMVWEPKWTREFLTAAGRRELGIT
ncbi:MAG: metal-sulfur cluster assembly factor [Bacteroidota bacterium]|jgi:metal-sulfur cluster biosynthetic enzyme|nr:metal-sulfur cluster assembly factor [Bacteroidota bacterium]